MRARYNADTGSATGTGGNKSSSSPTNSYDNVIADQEAIFNTQVLCVNLNLLLALFIFILILLRRTKGSMFLTKGHSAPTKATRPTYWISAGQR